MSAFSTPARNLAFIIFLVAVSFTAPSASAAFISYELQLRFQGDYVSELVSTPSAYEDDDWEQVFCYSRQDCYPEGFRPSFSDSIFRHLAIGELAEARFLVDSIGYGGAASCKIAGWDYDCYTGNPNSTLSQVGFFSPNTSSLMFDLQSGTLSYSGEAGNTRPFAVPGCTPFVEDFCDYFGYGANFSIVSFTVSSIPLPYTLPLLLSVFLGIAAMARWRGCPGE